MAVHGTDANRSRDRTRLTGRLQGSVLVLAPDRACGARVADRARLIHGPKWKRMLDAAEQAVDLDRGRVAGEDADVADRAATDATGSRDAPAVVVPLDRTDCHR